MSFSPWTPAATAHLSSPGTAPQQQQQQQQQQPSHGQAHLAFGYGNPSYNGASTSTNSLLFRTAAGTSSNGHPPSSPGPAVQPQQQQQQQQTPKRAYLPGYLSSASLNLATPSRSGDLSNDDSAPASLSASNGDPASPPLAGRFHGALFASTTTPSKSPKHAPYRDPPRRVPAGVVVHSAATGPQRMNDDDGPPTESLSDLANGASSSPSRTLESPHKDQGVTLRPRESDRTFTSSKFRATFPVVVFGFPPEHRAYVATVFESIGQTSEPVDASPPARAGDENWVVLNYLDPNTALKASRRDGEVLSAPSRPGGVSQTSFMVGVRPVDEAALRDALPVASLSPAQQPKRDLPSPVPTRADLAEEGGASQSFSRPVPVLGPASAFMPTGLRTPSRSPQDGTPLGRSQIFQQAPQQEGAARSLWTKVSDVVFGF